MVLINFLFAILLSLSSNGEAKNPSIIGAWQVAEDGVTKLLIISENHFSICEYKSNPAEFLSTYGGSWKMVGGNIEMTDEFNTANKDKIGQHTEISLSIKGGKMQIGVEQWTRVDNGKPGKLAGAWLFTGRKNGEKISTTTPGDRRTMKILSGKHFQWIAYNVATKEFFGTGGGSYTTKSGKYVETIEFFSKDNSRVGASLDFDYELMDGKWHHSGLSSKGSPIYEVWSTRKSLGM